MDRCPGALRKLHGRPAASIRQEVRRLRDAGFTLIEMLVVVAILALLLALGVAQLTRSRIVTNEHLALNSLRTLAKACQLYSLVNRDYPADLKALGLPEANPPYLQPDLIGDGARVVKQGYVFEYGQTSSGAGFALSAEPKTPKVTGTRYFYTDQHLRIHVDQDGPAGDNDPTIP